ncbi:putative dna repair protein swi5 [Erysiphe neolycopersici]|uniref:Putative dna repair protein swi5 n=1 Tax=Erysiphe neolycopersici TaxID=212602 RepID=A0A420HSV7_9PEZI|nr:putative dna repair protein swi5 [Erysiphe neolycopersici]
MMMTSNDYDMEHKKTLNASDQEESEANQENGQGNINFIKNSEIEDSDVELMDSSINSSDINRERSENISRNTDHILESFSSETQGNKLIEANQLQEKEIIFNQIQKELPQSVNDNCLVASNSRETKANLKLPGTTEASNSSTNEFSSLYTGSTQLALIPEQNSPKGTVEEPKVFDTEDLKALPLTVSTASTNPQCSPEQIWPSSQENVAMFEVSEQDLRKSSAKADISLPSIESTAFISSSVVNNKAGFSLSQATETDQSSPKIEDSTITTTLSKSEHIVHIEAPSRDKSTDNELIDISMRRIPTSNTITLSNNSTCLPPERIDNNARASLVLPRKLGISTPKQSRVSREPGFLSKKAQILPTSRNSSSETSFASSTLSRSLLTPGPRKNLEATLITSTNASIITQADPIDVNNLSPFIPPPRTHSVYDSFSSSPSSGVSICNTSSPTMPESSPERAKEILLAELKTIKIASITARNTALEAELANKRVRLEEITRDLRAPAQETVRRHIKLLHDYNDIRDIGQGLIGMIAEQRGVQIGSLYEDYGVGVKD